MLGVKGVCWDGWWVGGGWQQWRPHSAGSFLIASSAIAGVPTTLHTRPSACRAAFKSSDAGWAAARGKGEAAGDGKFSAFLGEYVAVPTEAEVATVSGRCGWFCFDIFWLLGSRGLVVWVAAGGAGGCGQGGRHRLVALELPPAARDACPCLHASALCAR